MPKRIEIECIKGKLLYRQPRRSTTPKVSYQLRGTDPSGRETMLIVSPKRVEWVRQEWVRKGITNIQLYCGTPVQGRSTEYVPIG